MFAWDAAENQIPKLSLFFGTGSHSNTAKNSSNFAVLLLHPLHYKGGLNKLYFDK